MSDSLNRNGVRKDLKKSAQCRGSRFDEGSILGHADAQFVKTHVIKTSNDTFHVVMTLACVMVSFSDGATVTMFPGHFNCVAVLVESAQTLTSRMVNLLRNAATEINRHVRDSVQAKLVDTEMTVNAKQIATVNLQNFSQVSKERAVVLTANRVQSRTALPDGYVLLDGGPMGVDLMGSCTWVPLRVARLPF